MLPYPHASNGNQALHSAFCKAGHDLKHPEIFGPAVHMDRGLFAGRWIRFATFQLLFIVTSSLSYLQMGDVYPFNLC
jgi:hypothetical protein